MTKNLSVNGSRIDTTTNFKYLGVHLDPTWIQETAGRVNLLRRIRSDTDTLSAERIYKAMIMLIFTYTAAKLPLVGQRHVGAKYKKPGTTKSHDYSAKPQMSKQ